MRKLFFRNAANFIVVARTLMIFIAIWLFIPVSAASRLAGAGILAAAALMDWLDGHVARKYAISSKLGGFLDTLGDRITENLLLFFFAYEQLIPLFVPLIFVARSFISDFVRHMNFLKGESTFSINRSLPGIIFVSSRTSRALYLLLKFMVFFMGGAILVLDAGAFSNWQPLAVMLRTHLYSLSILLVVFNLLRFAFLIYDSRNILREEFMK